MSTYVLFNGLSGNGSGTAKAEEIKGFLNGKEPVFTDVTKLDGYKAFIEGLGADDEIYLCGGDGTLNRFINDTDIREHRKVCLAGERVVAELFDHDNPVGEELTVDGKGVRFRLAKLDAFSGVKLLRLVMRLETWKLGDGSPL